MSKETLDLKRVEAIVMRVQDESKRRAFQHRQFDNLWDYKKMPVAWRESMARLLDKAEAAGFNTELFTLFDQMVATMAVYDLSEMHLGAMLVNAETRHFEQTQTIADLSIARLPDSMPREGL